MLLETGVVQKIRPSQEIQMSLRTSWSGTRPVAVHGVHGQTVGPQHFGGFGGGSGGGYVGGGKARVTISSGWW